jgi:hypothetical protein
VNSSSASHVSRRGHHGCDETTLKIIGAKLYNAEGAEEAENAEVAEDAELCWFAVAAA